MATKAQVEAAITRLVANEAKFDAWLNGDAEDTVTLGETVTPSLLGIVAAMELPAYASRDLANTGLARIGRVFVNTGEGFIEVTSAAS